MNGEFEIKVTKSYATKKNAQKAVEKTGDQKFRHFYMTTEEGRFFPVFVGQVAIDAGVHFRWHVVG